MTWWPPIATEPRRRLFSLWFALALAAPACGPSRAELDADRARLREALGLDDGVSRTLQRADRAMALSQQAEAQRLVLAEAKPAAAENLRRAEGLAASTDWGKARQGELRALLRDRAASLDEYAAAMGSGDAERVLTALEGQRDIERKAIDLVRALEPAP